MGEDEAPWAHQGQDRAGHLGVSEGPAPEDADDGLTLLGEGSWLTVAPGVQLRAEDAPPPAAAGGGGRMHRAVAGSGRAGLPPGGARRASGDATDPTRAPSPDADMGAADIRARAPRRRRSALGALGRTVRVAAAALAVLTAIAVLLAARTAGRSGSLTEPTTRGPAAAAASNAPAPTEAPARGTRTEAVPGSADRSEKTAASAPTGGSTPPPGSAASGGSAAGTDWWSVIAGLDRRRAAALAGDDLHAVSEYAAAGSTFWDTETELLDGLRAGQLRPRGWSTQLVAIEAAVDLTGAGGEALAGQDAASATGAAVRLTIVDRRSGYELVDGSGTVVRAVAAAGKRRWQVSLVRSGAGTAAEGEEQSGQGGAGQQDAGSAVFDDLIVGTPDPGGPTAGADPTGAWRIMEVVAVPDEGAVS